MFVLQSKVIATSINARNQFAVSLAAPILVPTSNIVSIGKINLKHDNQIESNGATGQLQKYAMICEVAREREEGFKRKPRLQRRVSMPFDQMVTNSGIEDKSDAVALQMQSATRLPIE